MGSSSIVMDHFDNREENGDNVTTSVDLHPQNLAVDKPSTITIDTRVPQSDAIFFSDSMTIPGIFFIDTNNQSAHPNKHLSSDLHRISCKPENSNDPLQKYRDTHGDDDKLTSCECGINIEKIQAAPPKYNSLVEWILNDPPPEYGEVTGVEVHVDEVNILKISTT